MLMNKLNKKSLQNSQNNHIPHIPFYFVRHGRTDWTMDNKVMGQIDIPLNENGIEQAHVIAQKIPNFDISHIFSSPLKRAMQTSEIIAKATSVPISTLDELKNAYAGIMEGQDKGDGKWLENWKRGATIEGAEHWTEFVSRVAIGLNNALAHATNEKPILIVGHGPTYWALLHILNAQTTKKSAKNCEVYFFNPPDADSNQWRVNVE